MSDEFLRGIGFGLFIAIILLEVGDEVRRRWRIRIERRDGGEA